MAGVCKDPDQKAGHPEGRAQGNSGYSVSIKGERDKEKSWSYEGSSSVQISGGSPIFNRGDIPMNPGVQG